MTTASTGRNTIAIMEDDPPCCLEFILKHGVTFNTIFKSAEQYHVIAVDNSSVVVARAWNVLTLPSNHPLVLCEFKLIKLCVVFAVGAVSSINVSVTIVNDSCMMGKRTRVLFTVLLKCNGLPAWVSGR